MPAHKKPTPEKHCEFCGKKLERKTLPNGDLEYLIHFNARKFCDRVCWGKETEKRKKSPNQKPDVKWSAAHRKARNICPKGDCQKCGKPDAKDVHHRDGNFRNNSPENLERICRSCHLKEHRKRRPCLICGKPQEGCGYCEMHYQRFKKWGDPLLVKDNQFTAVRRDTDQNKKRECVVPGCEASAHAKGHCGRHWMQKRRGTLGSPQKTKSEIAKEMWANRRSA